MPAALLNPLKRLRLDAQLSMDELAEAAGVNHNSIVRNEQAVYSSPGPTLLNYLLSISPDVDRASVISEYTDFQRLTRQTNYGILPVGFLDNLYKVSFSKNPCTAWREAAGISKIKFSVLYCVHPAIVSKLENQPWLCATLPTQYTEALFQSGYNIRRLDDLQVAFLGFKECVRNSNVA